MAGDIVIDSFINDDVFGNGTPPNGADTGSWEANAIGNSVTVTNNGEVGGVVYGGRASDGYLTYVANNNNVIIDGNVTESVYGGSGGGGAMNNNVIVNGGTIRLYVIGGESYRGDAMFNNVTINDGTILENVSGGVVRDGDAKYNNVVINGGSIKKDVQGGYSSGNGNATYNTVTISGSPNFSSSSSLHGGVLAGTPGNRDAFAGNTLNVWNYSGTAVAGVSNFENFNFVFPTTQSSAILQANGTVTLGNGPGKGSTVTGVSTNGGPAPMQPGDTVTLIKATTLNASDFNQTTAQGKHGATCSITGTWPKPLLN